MESYVEITWLINGILICLCSLIGVMLFQQTVKVTKTIISSFLFAMYLMMVQASWWLILTGELIFGMVVFRKINKAMFVGLSIRTLILLTLHGFFSKTAIGFIWYVPLKYSMMTLLLVPVFLCFLYFLPRISIRFLKSNYSYPVTIQIQEMVIKAKGYLDSGNVATHHNIPIIFISRKACPQPLEQQLQHMKEVKVAIRTLLGSSQMNCYLAKLHIPGYQEREVLVGFMDELKVKQDCDVLLNVKVFQVR